jgi:hypothetical protein
MGMPFVGDSVCNILADFVPHRIQTLPQSGAMLPGIVMAS